MDIHLKPILAAALAAALASTSATEVARTVDGMKTIVNSLVVKG